MARLGSGRKSRAAVAACVVLALLTWSQAAGAFAIDGPCGDNVELKMQFSGGSEWFDETDEGDTFLSLAIDAFNRWTAVERQSTGGSLFVNSGDDVQLKWSDMGTTGSLARASCIPLIGNKKIELNRDRLDDFRSEPSLSFIQVAAHEWGHHFGLGHSGKSEPWFGSNFPTMTTCLSATERASVTALSPDDFGGAASIEENGLWVAVTGNAGFENGKYNWAEASSTGSIQPRTQVGDGDGGNDVYQMDADIGTEGAIVSRIRVYDGRGSSDGDMGNVRFHARINSRDVVPNGLGKVTFLARARAVVYEDAGHCNDPHDNLNDVEFVKNEWLNLYGFMFPQAGWTFITGPEGQGNSPVLDPGSQFGGSDRPDALEMDLIISNRVKQDSPPGIVPVPVRIDRNRIRVDF